MQSHGFLRSLHFVMPFACWMGELCERELLASHPVDRRASLWMVVYSGCNVRLKDVSLDLLVSYCPG